MTAARSRSFGGRSPRMRGSHVGRELRQRGDGSIPADAGEPSSVSFVSCVSRVDPRGCGGAPTRRTASRSCGGRSPRMRGSPKGAAWGTAIPGSIPADAGEPLGGGIHVSKRRVDPRGCGGAQRGKPKSMIASGRSPRMRGSRLAGHGGPISVGSIPADAGEPGQRRCAECASGVDPRGCGGAAGATGARRGGRGRSPRMRGSLSPIALDRGRVGSIPADAGEPGSFPLPGVLLRVDPRGCGGAERAISREIWKPGRSPRMRGSPDGLGVAGAAAGSIPADAGEPAAWTRHSTRSRVDPRGCGGAPVAAAACRAVEGRSPRMRGSRCGVSSQRRQGGSIPADAGEPSPIFARVAV